MNDFCLERFMSYCLLVHAFFWPHPLGFNQVLWERICVHVRHVICSIFNNTCVFNYEPRTHLQYAVISWQGADNLWALMWSEWCFFPPCMWEWRKMWEDVQLSASTSNRFLKWKGEKHHPPFHPPHLLPHLSIKNFSPSSWVKWHLSSGAFISIPLLS